VSYTRERERGSVLRERERDKKNFFRRIEKKKSVKNVTHSAAKNTIDSLIIPLKKEI
tara:strand:- start:1875 stop:2045 length:171 start_codon:yes stop_codon:yes gene_type:complete